MIKCSICDKEFKNVSALSGHMRIHSDIVPNKAKQIECKICGKLVSSRVLKRHEDSHKTYNEIQSEKCLYCNDKCGVKYSRYASGKFCSKECATLYSSNYNRKDTNEKISNTLISKKTGKYHKCKNSLCNNIVYGSKKLYCNNECKKTLRKYDNVKVVYEISKETRKKLSIARINSIKKGKTNFNSIKCEYKFKDKLIKCDSKLEFSCLNYFETNFNVIDIERNVIVIPYTMENKDKLFLPDFKIITDSESYLVEVKSDIIGNKLNEKWHFYKESAILKKEALEKYCVNSKYIPFWFTKKMNRKFYNNLKFN